MADSVDAAPSGTALEALQNQSNQSRRARPPDLHLSGGDGLRVPLKPTDAEKLGRRESKLGLRNIFGRHKDKSNVEPEGGPLSPRDLLQRPGGIRASLAELSSNWPYGSHAARSELALSAAPSHQNLKHKKSASAVRAQPLAPRASRNSMASWEPPPLFQAYPQAIKHAHLPACTLSAESIIRLHGSKGSMSMREVLNLDPTEPGAGEKEKAKRRTRRMSGSAFDWTTKVFVLATSGYLLQYAGEGPFDRLPERMLHLGKDSAAFASDVIPGRHWVLQVSSVMDAEGSSTSHSSLLSRLPSFRPVERKHAATFLMVFESADDMDSWIATLRREIESLGGKKNLSETGKPKVDGRSVGLKSQPSQRTLVVRDPDRYSRVIAPEVHWEQGAPIQSPEIHFDNVDDVRDQSFDETSSASAYSQDGQQLEGLRDSANRLSFISSGQRTMVTSAGSSPACSPVRDSFASIGEDITLTELPRDQTRARPRPNAALINDRRQSMQTMNHMELRVASATLPRPHSTYSSSCPLEPSPSFSPPTTTTPNFSVPNGAGKRYSLAKSPSMESGNLGSSPVQARSKSMRRPPPTALAINPRPLSFVEDQPSPMSPPAVEQVSPPLGNLASPPVAPDTTRFSAFAYEEMKVVVEEAAKTAPLPQEPTTPARSYRDGDRPRTSSFGTSSPDRPVVHTPEMHNFVLPNNIPIPPLPPTVELDSTTREPLIRSKSSLGHRSRSPAPPPPPPPPLTSRRSVHGGRLSLHAPPPERAVSVAFRRSRTGADLEIGLQTPHFDPRDLPQRSRTPSLKPSARLSTSSQHLRIDSFNKTLMQRKSMSQLVVDAGPPPAPPPTCALPPIPAPPPTYALPPLPVKMVDGNGEGILI